MSGVLIYGAAANGNTVAGNYVGIDTTGTASLGNTLYGIRLESSATGNLIGTNGDGLSDDEQNKSLPPGQNRR